jgi:predicted Zn-dependent protease
MTRGAESISLLEGIMKSISGWAKEIEMLFHHESLNSISLLDGVLTQETKIENHNVMLTAINKNVVSRKSWSACDIKPLRSSIQESLSREKFAGTDIENICLNSPESISPTTLPVNESPEGLAPEAATSLARSYHRRLHGEWPQFRFNIYVETSRNDFSICNSRDLKGSYGRTQFRSGIGFRDTASQSENFLRFSEVESEDQMLERVRKHIIESKTAVPLSRIRGGSSPVLLSPTVVALLCLKISAALRADAEWSPRIADALPESFELWDEPELGGGLRFAPFDDEGSPTSKKLLCLSNRRVNTLSSLSIAARLGVKSSGNAFRRGTFYERPVDLTPTIRPCQLRLNPGTTTRNEIYAGNKELVVIDQINMPFAQIYSADSTHPTCLMGRVFQSGQLIAKLVNQNPLRTSLISARSHGSRGSLIDRNAIILSEGTQSDAGWFPYIFLPKFAW